MKRELPLHAFAGDDAADGEHLLRARTAASDHDAGENLNPLLFAFKNLRVNVDGVADFELRNVLTFLEAALFDESENLVRPKVLAALEREIEKRKDADG